MDPLYLPGCPQPQGQLLAWRVLVGVLASTRTQLPALPLYHGEAGMGITQGQVSSSVYLFKGCRSCN